MKLDESGYPQPTGEYETIAADSVVLALGQDTNLGFLAAMPNLQVDRGSVVVDADMMTSVPGVFAGGDMVPGDRNVTVAIGHGKRAARAIDAWLKGVTATKENRLAPHPLIGLIPGITLMLRRKFAHSSISFVGRRRLRKFCRD